MKATVSPRKKQQKSTSPLRSQLSSFFLLVAIAVITMISLLLLYLTLKESSNFPSTQKPTSVATSTLGTNVKSNEEITSTKKPVLPVPVPVNNAISSKTPLLLNKENRVKFDLKNIPKQHMGYFDMHFIHIPKCGGTSMTAILREVACNIDKERNSDCCLNPGFCDWHAKRRCSSIRGCINHIPQRPWIFKKELPSITILREPVSRIISAWFYRGHSPNNDFFQVRPYFKDIRDGKLPKVIYEEYIEMTEYQNIQTRMLGADSFPYRNISITDEIYQAAVDAVNNIYFVGLQEVYELSVQLLLRELNMHHLNISVVKERDQFNPKLAAQKKLLKDNKALMARTAVVNHYDIALYKLATAKFCITLSYYPDLLEKARKSKKINCDEFI